MQTTLPKITIIMPVLNRHATIEKAIRSVLDQHYDNLEFIIIDGASTDGTVDIIKRYDAHLAYWHSQPDGSPTLAVNFAIQKATGDVIALLMADDWYEPGILQKIGAAAAANPQADIISCGGRIVHYDTEKQAYIPQLTYAPGREMALTFYNICFAVSAICCRFIRKSLYERIGAYQPFDDKGKHIFSNDKEFLMRAVLAQASNVFVEGSGHTYFANPESSTFGAHQRNRLRLCVEHMAIAQTYLHTKPLSFKHRWLLKYWHNDQSTRLVLYKLLQGELRAALVSAKEGMRRYPLLWPLVFCYTTTAIAIKRSARAIRSVMVTRKFDEEK